MHITRNITYSRINQGQKQAENFLKGYHQKYNIYGLPEDFRVNFVCVFSQDR